VKFVAVTACPTGIAHSAMAAESIEVAARNAGHEIEVEVQGAGGAVPIDPVKIAEADAVIFAVDAGVRNRERFAHLPAVEVRTREAIDRGPALIEQAEQAAQTRVAAGAGAPGAPARPVAPMTAASPPGSSAGEKLRIWLMTGVSYMLPFVIAGGILIALGFMIGGAQDAATAADAEGLPSFGDVISSRAELGGLLVSIGRFAFGMLVPILAGFIAFGMVDRPGIAPGVVAGLIAIDPAINGGFLGGLIGGLLAGAVVMMLQRVKITGALGKMWLIIIIPVVGTLITGAIMILVVGKPIAEIQQALTDWLDGLQGSSAILLGALLGLMMAFDMGGPVNKVAYAFGVASLAEGNFTIMAAVMAAGMTPPLGIALASAVRGKLFTEEERDAGQANWLLGASFITEGAIPFAAADPLRVIPSLMVGSAVAGALSMAFDAGSQAPHGGIWVIGLIDSWFGWLLAIIVGTCVTAALLVTLKTAWKSKASIEELEAVERGEIVVHA
jgi:fructose PTS system EIIBC or EIIC component